jgi:integrase
VPKYSRCDINYIIRLEEFKRLFYKAPNIEHKTWISLLWLTGGRPAEILELTKKDIDVQPEYITIRIVTKKLVKTKDKDKRFILNKRNLKIKIPVIEPWIQTLQRHLGRLTKDDQRLFIFSNRTGYNIVANLTYDVLGRTLCPYNFRHSRMTLLAESGATADELKRFKGSSTDSSVRTYIHAREIEYTAETTIPTS